MGRRVKINPRRGSHLPILLRALKATTGPVLELGAGIYSTPILHAICEVEGRHLTTYESDPEFFEWAAHYQADFHDVRKVEDWGAIDISTTKWAVAFVDHAPDDRRYREIARLTQSEYVVAHDSDRGWNNKYNYPKIYPLFKYQRQFRKQHPNTVVLSNWHALEGL